MSLRGVPLTLLEALAMKIHLMPDGWWVQGHNEEGQTSGERRKLGALPDTCPAQSVVLTERKACTHHVPTAITSQVEDERRTKPRQVPQSTSGWPFMWLTKPS